MLMVNTPKSDLKICNTERDVVLSIKETGEISGLNLEGKKIVAEEWTFTLADSSQITKKVLVLAEE